MKHLPEACWAPRPIYSGSRSLKHLPKYGAPGKQNRRGAPIVPGRLTSDGTGYAQLGNGALVVAVEPTRSILAPRRDRKQKRYIRRVTDHLKRLAEDLIREEQTTARLQRRHERKKTT